MLISVGVVTMCAIQKMKINRLSSIESQPKKVVVIVVVNVVVVVFVVHGLVIVIGVVVVIIVGHRNLSLKFG